VFPFDPVTPEAPVTSAGPEPQFPSPLRRRGAGEPVPPPGPSNPPAARSGNGWATAADLQLPLSPAAGLPLYRALLQDLPSIGSWSQPGDLRDDPPGEPGTPSRHGRRSQLQDEPDDVEDDEPEPPQPPNRPRRRPTVIDLTRDDNPRSPFG
jgi:hypothetical protein